MLRFPKPQSSATLTAYILDLSERQLLIARQSILVFIQIEKIETSNISQYISWIEPLIKPLNFTGAPFKQ